jgi:hypothetical protein
MLGELKEATSPVAVGESSRIDVFVEKTIVSNKRE